MWVSEGGGGAFKALLFNHKGTGVNFILLTTSAWPDVATPRQLNAHVYLTTCENICTYHKVPIRNPPPSTPNMRD